jgi:hypothetical protein
MTITLTLGTWMVPLTITFACIICVQLMNIFEDDGDWEELTFITLVGACVAAVTAWVVWLIMTLITK